MDLSRLDLDGLFFDSPVSLPPHPDDEPDNVVPLRPDNVVPLRPDGEVDA